MTVQVREKTIEEIEGKLNSMNTALNKISYLESALRESGFSFEIKRFIWGVLAKLYEERKMFDQAARVMASKATVEIMVRDRMDSYVTAARFYALAGKVDDAGEMFFRARRDLGGELREGVLLAQKNIFMISAKELEDKGKRASAVKFYEKLLKMDLEDIERAKIRTRLISTYKTLGLFREARLLEGN